MRISSEINAGQAFIWFAVPAVLVVGAILCLCIWGISRPNGTRADSGWSAIPSGNRWFVSQINPQGPAAGKLRIGDQLISIDGSRRIAQFGPSPQLKSQSGEHSIEVLRNGLQVKLALPVAQTSRAGWRISSYLCLAIVNLVIAIWIGFSRPDYAVARLAFFLFLATARTFEADVFGAFSPPLPPVILVITALFTAHIWMPIEWAVAFDFALRFPEPLLQPRVLRLLRIFLYVAGVLVLTIGLLPLLADVFDLENRSALLPVRFPLVLFDELRQPISEALGALALLAVPIVLARNYWRLPDPFARRRVRWVALGIGLTTVPIAVEIFATLLLRSLGYTSAEQHVGDFLDLSASLFSALAPVTFAYAIVKHRVLGIRFVIRRGIQYLLAKNVLRIILWLPLIAISVDIVLHPREPLADFLLNGSWWFFLLLIGSASLTLRYRTRLQFWVDKKFFRSAYEEEAILSELIDSMQACENSDEVARVVAEKLENSLHPSSISVLYRKEADGLFTVGYPRGQALGLQFRGILNDRVQDALQAHRAARTFTEITAAVQDGESASNDIFRNTLLTPISSPGGQLLGVLLLGEKKSEQSYSNRDRKLLQAVAIQMGLVLEMLALRDQVREEGRVRIEVLGHLDQNQVQLVLECPRCGACYTNPTTRCIADGSTVGLTLPIERIIEGKYRLERRIGTGGMGAVYEAFDLRLDRIVAVKVMTGRLFGNNSALRRFEREARAAARLQHPSIVAIYDFGSLRGGGAYLVMQRIAGRSWRAETVRTGQIPPYRAAIWMDQLCDAMACAHSSGVIHRDLKPENLLVSPPTEDGEKITVLDFGVAKLHTFREVPEPELTSVDRVVGTYGYMSPEQRAGEPVDARTDIYSAAVIAAEILSNNRPAASGASRSWLQSALRWPEPTTPESGQLVQLLDCCLDDSPSKRLTTIQELQHQLIPLLYKSPPPLSVRVSGAASADAETIPI